MSKTHFKRSSSFFTHRLLWKASKSLRDQMNSTDLNPTHFEYSAYLTLYFTLESYLNYLGDTAFSETWANEREFFSINEYKGTLGKLQWLSEQLNITQVSDFSKRPGQTISNLNKIRNCLVHGGLEKNEAFDEIDFEDLTIETMLKNSIEKRKHDKFLDHCFDDIEAIISKLNQSAEDNSQNGRKYRIASEPLMGTNKIEIGG
ncbi:MAG: hypothetical protein WD607_01000 [Candidatus Paceibacterota bacterium]